MKAESKSWMQSCSAMYMMRYFWKTQNTSPEFRGMLISLWYLLIVLMSECNLKANCSGSNFTFDYPCKRSLEAPGHN